MKDLKCNDLSNSSQSDVDYNTDSQEELQKMANEAVPEHFRKLKFLKLDNSFSLKNDSI